MPNRDEQQHESPRDVPPVGRPRGAVWRSLQADGVVWEGQVLLVGDDVDLAARMIVTHRRVVFVRGGEVVLEMPRGWLRPEPVLRRDGILELFVAMPGSDLFDEPLGVPLRMREGHPAAGHIIAMLAPSGVRHIAPDALSGLERAREATPPPRFGSFWEDPEPLAAGSGLVGAVDDFDQYPDQSAETDRSDWAPIEPPDRVVRVPSNPPKRPGTSAFPIAGMLPRDQRRSPWRLLIRVAALTVLLATAAALGAGKLDIQIPGAAHEPVLIAPTATVPVTSSPTQAPEVALSPNQESAIAFGVGGPAAQDTADETATTQAAATPAETPAPVLAPTAPAIPTPAPTTAAEPIPTSTPQATATVAPAAATAAGTPLAPAAEAGTPDESAATQGQSSLTQAAAVDPGDPPAQEIVVGPLRLIFQTALRGESLPRYALPPGSGEWLLLTADVRNESDAAATLAMSDLRLFDRGTATVLDLDSGTDVIATLAGFDPALSNDDVVPIEPGEAAEALLLYLLPPGASDDLTLLVGQTSIDLGPSLALGEAAPAAEPELLEATVAAVGDGSRLTVDIAGQEETVQYLGLTAPTGDACFAAEATTANAALVEGEQVWLERQATDRTEDGALLRDVWIADANGDRVLVAARLLEAGAATPAAAPPDTRYQAWLEAAAALARSNGAGLWGACGDVSASAAVAPDDAPRLAYLSGAWRGNSGLHH
jgi:endonuclease YncB( thermonuclease family)